MSIDWNNDDSAFYPYFAIGGNSLCANIPECILNSENFNVSLDQFYYSIQVTDNQDCGTVGIKNTKIIPDDFKFNNPYPNPFNPRTKFFIDFPSASYLTLSVYDINGELVSTLYNGRIRSGIRKFIWDANGYSSGVYLIKASTKAKIIYKKVIFTK